MPENVTKLSALGLGVNALAAGVVSAAVAGSGIFQGDVVFDPSGRGASGSGVNIIYESGSFLTYQETILSNSGGTTPNKYRAQLRNPHSGSGAIHWAMLSCRGIKQVMNFDIGTHQYPNQSGQNILNTFSGPATGRFLDIPNQSGAYMWNEDQFVSVVSVSGSSVNRQLPDCKFGVWSSGTYSG